ncbi:TPA: hypothetical protein ACPZW1_001945 [Enterobacter hormaechei subsp. hoffmannii]|uniref:hypothetical protein n=1 Tax=Enterobacter cloacae complex TaxID=354276 RepID=UPI0006A6BFD8|nr:MULTISPECIES: hypothetical protein [Enterobacter cloacae complex]EKU4501694.1 hypothetical protein [Enterobacter hormaechei]MCK2092349.1 hypothetical protein [Enterobacter hormaechei]MDW2986786.1 hypothetical protein [Enterobacter cloacae complex sp. 2023EL-01177]OEG94227.1 hypothetical protein AN661_0210795 [Enterobacter hormaechei subsp. hoffmannii]PJD37361.1 hypothetical protein B9Q36_11095 [Enterobacter hormaechei]
MITEKDNVFYCDCGFSFERGRSGAHSCETGLRKKIAESEAKLAALAVENAGLKKVSATDSETMLLALDAFNTHGSTRPDAGLKQAINFVMQRRQTPATDAFLAEVRAQGVEMFAAHKRERQQALRSRSMRMSEEAAGMAADAENFADELRKGVQS